MNITGYRNTGELIAAVFTAFAQHIKNTVPARSVMVTSVTFDPTYGQRESTEEIDMVDPVKLSEAFDSFGEKLAHIVQYDGDLDHHFPKD